jgi:hypothetical protein
MSKMGHPWPTCIKRLKSVIFKRSRASPVGTSLCQDSGKLGKLGKGGKGGFQGFAPSALAHPCAQIPASSARAASAGFRDSRLRRWFIPAGIRRTMSPCTLGRELQAERAISQSESEKGALRPFFLNE